MHDTAPHACAHLARLLALHSRLDCRALERALLALTAASAANAAAAAAVACLLPRRHATRAAAFALLAAPLCILLPFLLLDARRSAMHAGLARCRLPRKTVDTRWQAPVVLLCVAVALALGVRVAVAARERVRRGRRKRPPASEVLALLVRLRAKTPGKLRDMACAICLDDMRDHELSWLDCRHAYHEKCFAAWVHFAPQALCPMCKKSAWPEGGFDLVALEEIVVETESTDESSSAL